MAKYLFLFLLLTPGLCANQSWYSYVVFWNIGQGQWITAVTPQQCIHYDFGGEINYFSENRNLFLQLCKNKQNILHLSHPDLDHYAFYPLLARSLAHLCWREVDHTSLPAKRTTKKIPLCTEAVVNQLENNSQRLFKPKHFTNKNDSSKVYSYKTILIPGDSSKKQEKIWVKNITNPENFRVLLLGHHGSRTSTSDFLLHKLFNVKMAIVQSRRAKFNHPHPEVLQKLKKYRISLITTEDWGNIAVDYSTGIYISNSE